MAPQAFKFTGIAPITRDGVFPRRSSFLAMSVRSWVSRLSFWLAAFCAVLSFVVEAPLGPRLGSLAIICAVFSLLV